MISNRQTKENRVEYRDEYFWEKKMKKVKFLYDKVMEITGQVGKDHVGAYLAQAQRISSCSV